MPGIKFLREPYPHVAVGDPKLSSNDAKGTGPQVSTPVNLVVLKKGDEAEIKRTTDVWKKPEHVFSVAFDGRELKQKNGRREAA